MTSLTTVFLFLFFTGLVSSVSFHDLHPDRCWMNENLNESNVLGACPLFSPKYDRRSFCVVTLKPEKKPRNNRCRRCVWKDKEEGICQPTVNWKTRDCCCSTPRCNKRLFKDTLPGWHKNTLTLTIENSCVHAVYQNDRWRMFGNKSRTFSNHKCNPWLNSTTSSREDRKCILQFKKSDNRTNPKVHNLWMGCERTKDDCKGVLNRNCETNKTTGKTTCCCRGRQCNKELYMRFGFDSIMAVRFHREKLYNTQMKHAKDNIPKRIWFMDEDYLKSKVIVETVVLTATAVYVIFMCSAYQFYKPLDLDERPKNWSGGNRNGSAETESFSKSSEMTKK